MLPSVDPSGRLSGLMALAYAAALVPIAAAVYPARLAGPGYLAGAVVLGAGFVVFAWGFNRRRTESAARHLFLASIIFLPLLLTLMVADPGGGPAPGATAEARVVQVTPERLS
jgi:protoheme IX farnesyltransferase